VGFRRCAGLFSVIKRTCEIKGDDTRDQLGADVQAPNEDIQFGNYFGRFERASDIDRVFIQRMVRFSKVALLSVHLALTRVFAAVLLSIVRAIRAEHN
jgi:hypothetical protein